MRGAAYERKGDLERAVADYTEVIRLTPSFAPAYVNRGDCYTGRASTTKPSQTTRRRSGSIRPLLGRILTGAFLGQKRVP